MATGTLFPAIYQTVMDANGQPESGAKIYTYLAGTSTLATTWTNEALTVPSQNPIIADGAGRWYAYAQPGASYKFVITTSADVHLRTRDNVSAVPASSSNLDITGVAGEALTAGQPVYLSDGSGSKAAGQWFRGDSTNTYSSTLPIVGASIAAITAGSSGTIRLGGQGTGFVGLTVGTTYYIGASGAVVSTAPANRRIIGVADTTATIILAPAAPAIGPTSTITTTGTQTALAIPAGDGALTIFANNASTLTLQGITAGRDGQQLTLYAIGAGAVDLNDQNGSASAPNRLITNVAATVSLTPVNGRALLQYDSTTARWRILSWDTGEGVNFPATQIASTNANTLDDYEEGSWTPTIIGAGGGVSAAYAIQVGRYIKIAKQVWVQCYVKNSTGAAYVGAIQIAGLPFAAENTTNLYSTPGGVYWEALATNWVYATGTIGPNGSGISLAGATAAAANLTALASADIGNNTGFIVSATYRAAA